ncbi:MAG: hypothetical protein AB7N99_03225 [Simkaniaceae bacterium]
MTAIPTYLINEGLTSREGCRIFEGVCSVLRDTGTETLSVKGLDISLEPIQTFFKSVDSAWYIPKTVEAMPKVVDSLEAFKDQLHMFFGAQYTYSKKDDGTAMKVATTYLKLVRDVFKLIASAAASLKFLGTLGVAYLAPRVKVLNLTKNAFTVYTAVHDITEFSLKTIDDVCYKSDKERGKRIFFNLMGIYGLLCSVGLNGLGFLQATVGSGVKAPMPAFGWNAFKLGGSVSALVANALKAGDK